MDFYYRGAEKSSMFTSALWCLDVTSGSRKKAIKKQSITSILLYKKQYVYFLVAEG